MTTMLTDAHKWREANLEMARRMARKRPDLVDTLPADAPVFIGLPYQHKEYKVIQPSSVWREMLEQAVKDRREEEKAKLALIAKQAHMLVEKDREAQARELLMDTGFLGTVALSQPRYLEVSQQIDAIGPSIPDTSVA